MEILQGLNEEQLEAVVFDKMIFTRRNVYGKCS